jgi:hypothetical protein
MNVKLVIKHSRELRWYDGACNPMWECFWQGRLSNQILPDAAYRPAIDILFITEDIENASS